MQKTVRVLVDLVLSFVWDYVLKGLIKINLTILPFS